MGALWLVGCDDGAAPPLNPPDTVTAVPSPPQEARALWISRWDWEGEAELRALLDNAARANFNLIYFQARGRADAYYRSSLEPWAHRPPAFVLGQDPGWDPLGVALEVARDRGLELHVWLNALIGWCTTEAIPETTPRHILLEHPDWVMVDQEGRTTAENCNFLTPGEPGVRTQLAAVAAEIVRRYAVDGIHLDFIRYPNETFSYDAQSLAAFEVAREAEPEIDYDELRRRLVSAAVSEVHDSLGAADPNARLSAAVWGVYRNTAGWSGVSTGYDTRFQDARRWTELNIIDVLVPMVYWRIQPTYGARLDFAYLADEHVAAVPDRHVYVGMGVEESSSGFCAGCDVVRQIYRSRMAGAAGVSIFSGQLVRAADLWDELANGPFEQRVPVPAMPWRLP